MHKWNILNNFSIFLLAGSVDSTCGGSNQYHWSYTSPGKQLLILYGTEYGCSKEIAQELYDR